MISTQAFVPGKLQPGPPSGAPGITPTVSPSPTVRLLILIALYSVPVATIVRPLDEFDTWWHLRTGQWIAEHHAVPTSGIFSATGADQSWVAYSWLFELLLYGLYQLFGLGGVVLYRLLTALLLVAVLHRFVARREPRFVVTVGLVAAALAALAPLLCERPWLFSIIFCTLTVDAVLDLRNGTTTRTTWLLPLWFVLWVNLHIQFAFGLLVLGLACAAPGIDALLGRKLHGESACVAGSRGWWRLVGLTAACTLATLVNPYGWRLWTTLVEVAGGSAAFALVGETRSLGFRSPWDWAVLGLTLAATFELGRRQRLDVFEVLFLAIAAYVSFKCRRDLWLVVLASLTVLINIPRPAAVVAEPFVLTRGRALLFGLGIGAFLIALGFWADCSERRLAAGVSAGFPAQAAAVVEAHGFPGPLYNSADWGSYLMWRLPQLPVAIDGRFHLYGDERVARFHRTCEGRPGWADDPDLAAARLVILRAQAPLAELLRRDPRFDLVHEDPVAVVYVERKGE